MDGRTFPQNSCLLWLVVACWTSAVAVDRKQCEQTTPMSPLSDDCCMNYGLACKVEFDCGVGARNWERGWSKGKKILCCKAVGVGCPQYWPSDWRAIALCVALPLLIVAVIVTGLYVRRSEQREPAYAPFATPEKEGNPRAGTDWGGPPATGGSGDRRRGGF
eukprot:CAMPEP_0179260996 /NCGR_PEP_ID=MMETSP0797-20121207/26628_1 /TAXON_ID=47934 /ORGANISM="Dinophysis acuminata, Strain DAEP01" /LENGTH=161 /DNA_ID=CAMNT_0020969095 /DNA_START=109 /DNA_END=595 /DNA_ORIENTATION=+